MPRKSARKGPPAVQAVPDPDAADIVEEGAADTSGGAFAPAQEPVAPPKAKLNRRQRRQRAAGGPTSSRLEADEERVEERRNATEADGAIGVCDDDEDDDAEEEEEAAASPPLPTPPVAVDRAGVERRLRAAAQPRGPCFAATNAVEAWAAAQAAAIADDASAGAGGGTSRKAKTTQHGGGLSVTVQRSFLQSEGAKARFPPNVVRGVQNSTSNACYMAAVLQALVHCPPIAALLVQASLLHRVQQKSAEERAKLLLPRAGGGGGVKQQQRSLPIAAELGDWVMQYWASATGAPLSLPRAFTSGDVLLAGGIAATGRLQEDAAEFLSALLKTIDSDLIAMGVHVATTTNNAAANNKQPVAASNASSAKSKKVAEEDPSAGSSGGRGWVTVGKGKERLTVRSETELGHATGSGGDGAAAAAGGAAGPLSVAVLNGTMRRRTANARGVARGVTSVVVEPFTVLPAPVSASASASAGGDPTVLDCLHHSIISKEEVETADRTMKREARFGHAPLVLIVQLSRWAITREADVVKLSNRVRLASRLTIPRAWFDAANPSPAEYELSTVICHRGEHPSSGHYIAYVAGGRTVATGAAVAAAGAASGSDSSTTMAVANDARVHVVGLADGIAAAEGDSPYLLIYQRCGAASAASR